MELKTILYYLALNFNFEPTEKTQIPLKLKYNPIQFIPEKGVWVKFTPRNTNHPRYCVKEDRNYKKYKLRRANVELLSITEHVSYPTMGTFGHINMWVLLCAIVVIIFLVEKYLSREYDYFEKKGIPFAKPRFIVGSRSDFVLRNKSILEVMKDFYNEFRNDKVSGLFDFGSPVYVIRDPYLIKQLGVKDFDHFVDHKFLLDADPSLFGRALFNLRGQKWRDMRATLSPAFTVMDATDGNSYLGYRPIIISIGLEFPLVNAIQKPSKMRQMFELMNVVGQQFANTLMQQTKKGEHSFEFRELSRKFTVDVIATCALGIEVNSFENPHNDFHQFAVNMVGHFSSFLAMLKIVAYSFIPNLMIKLKVALFPEETTKYFRSAITETMKIREEKSIVRPDLINVLMQAKKGKLSYEAEKDADKAVDGFATVEESHVGRATVTRTWEDDDLVAQCMIFFFAGFESVSTKISFMAYELMTNPDCQAKLQEEIDEMHQKVDGKAVTYDQIQRMKYMDQVVCETLRKWPSPAIDRLCNKDFQLEYDDKKITIEEGRSFYIPVAAIHHDERYYENPDKFDPERFNEENRGKIDPGTYLPFGIGPRNCIGSRFALMELKTILYYLALNFHFEPTEKTQIPLKLKYNPVQLIPEKGVWVKFTPRK
ncbi:putative cytochrome P450 9f2 [Pseudolycoriella hygida]|uniref:Cytochrome P450 9f2 n=1 Tax=Pseudolycoriella hygida TaxID=35572 RepID=A0A9Q0NG36_9DIPT|nr:putative cytochrome P450 9f2 [Pseudolycoriella hygida]